MYKLLSTILAFTLLNSFISTDLAAASEDNLEALFDLKCCPAKPAKKYYAVAFLALYRPTTAALANVPFNEIKTNNDQLFSFLKDSEGNSIGIQVLKSQTYEISWQFYSRNFDRMKINHVRAQTVITRGSDNMTDQFFAPLIALNVPQDNEEFPGSLPFQQVLTYFDLKKNDIISLELKSFNANEKIPFIFSGTNYFICRYIIAVALG